MRLLLVALAALALAGPALASEQHPTLNELEGEVMCPTCHTTLDMSSSPIADRIRAYIRQWIAEGDTKSQIEAKLVAQFGEGVLAAPPKRGLGLLAWLLPLAGILAGAAALGFGAWKWSRFKNESDGCVTRHHSKGDAGGSVRRPDSGLEPELERRLDEELLRFDG